MKPIRMKIIDGLQFAIADYKNSGDEVKFKQRIGGLKGAHPLSYRNTLLLK